MREVINQVENEVVPGGLSHALWWKVWGETATGQQMRTLQHLWEQVRFDATQLPARRGEGRVTDDEAGG